EVWLVRPDGSELRQLAGFGADAAFLPRWLPGRAGRAGPALLGVTEVTGSVSRALLVDPVNGSRRTLAEGNLIALLDVAPDGSRVLLRRGTRGARHTPV